MLGGEWMGIYRKKEAWTNFVPMYNFYDFNYSGCPLTWPFEKTSFRNSQARSSFRNSQATLIWTAVESVLKTALGNQINPADRICAFPIFYVGPKCWIVWISNKITVQQCDSLMWVTRFQLFKLMAPPNLLPSKLLRGEASATPRSCNSQNSSAELVLGTLKHFF